MIHLVLDASTAIDWFVPSEEGEKYSRPLARLAASGEVRFSVPLHFVIEFTGHLVKKYRRLPQQFDSAWLQDALSVLFRRRWGTTRLSKVCGLIAHGLKLASRKFNSAGSASP